MTVKKKTERENIYSLRQTAQKLGIHYMTLRMHKTKGGFFDGIGEMVGHTWVFRETDIEALRKALASSPPPGRKPARGKSRMRDMRPAERFALAAKLKADGKQLEDIRQQLGYSDITSVIRAVRNYKRSAQAAQMESDGESLKLWAAAPRDQEARFELRIRFDWTDPNGESDATLYLWDSGTAYRIFPDQRFDDMVDACAEHEECTRDEAIVRLEGQNYRTEYWALNTYGVNPEMVRADLLRRLLKKGNRS